ncbi:MAG: imidazole glycerol phosphate synthase subunit HisH [Clostridiaceae bacterium]|nr:imidazole glycerol phosphate synthase subunit HisH [Clostridiales bacterium]MDD6878188.1 imidazole glycerol phosphate synthase subunit HisH [Clostridiaceae bacterium]MDY3071864.1 imidazole glycerol phosphate synthase subunit HisH [Eubacteriales bacterium]
MLAIVDYGVGNLHSVSSAFRYVGADTVVTADAGTLERADGIILPGVGAFPDAAESLAKTGLIPVIKAEAARKPLLGICLGMQLLFTESRELRPTPGLGLIPGIVDRIPTTEKLPQIGWNALGVVNPCALTDGLPEGAYVYFVHSYMAFCEDRADVAAVTDYGTEVTAMVRRGFVYGCQFHPEKSGSVGLGIIDRFCGAVRDCRKAR